MTLLVMTNPHHHISYGLLLTNTRLGVQSNFQVCCCPWPSAARVRVLFLSVACDESDFFVSQIEFNSRVV
jgi:hypothetical protein